jgi:spore coat protein U-like protein
MNGLDFTSVGKPDEAERYWAYVGSDCTETTPYGLFVNAGSTRGHHFKSTIRRDSTKEPARMRYR